VPVLTNQHDQDGTTSSYLHGLTREHRTLTHDGTQIKDQDGTGYYHTNPQSSILATTNQAGTVTATYQYDDYGTPTTAGTTTDQPVAGIHRNPHTYTGAYTTPTGLYQLGTRHYDPATTTFTTRDPAPTLARYHYGAGNPHTHTDPTGNTPTTQQWVGYGLGIAATIGGIILMIATAGIATPAVIAAIGVEIFLGVTATIVETVTIVGQHVGFISEHTAEILGWTGLGVGLIASLAVGAAARVGITAYRAAKAATIRTAEAEAHNRWKSSLQGLVGEKWSASGLGGDPTLMDAAAVTVARYKDPNYGSDYVRLHTETSIHMDDKLKRNSFGQAVDETHELEVNSGRRAMIVDIYRAKIAESYRRGEITIAVNQGGDETQYLAERAVFIQMDTWYGRALEALHRTDPQVSQTVTNLKGEPTFLYQENGTVVANNQGFIRGDTYATW
jgi:RHS repeat-associated protein